MHEPGLGRRKAGAGVAQPRSYSMSVVDHTHTACSVFRCASIFLSPTHSPDAVLGLSTFSLIFFPAMTVVRDGSLARECSSRLGVPDIFGARSAPEPRFMILLLNRLVDIQIKKFKERNLKTLMVSWNGTTDSTDYFQVWARMFVQPCVV
ncbi:hypothetical protein AG1IA_07218 [Rhizoctonia solani AG-1 IA]|uniref:Uncharacterized protein n=1 Tax=Thanatephorus cucumeris (strain AG1-IA) TaxID=983506 RepID=L8WQY8_THACA|nr:hypothetical protein AG1IA_07218 [Rhizoctonia solani AG-1 IA]